MSPIIWLCCFLPIFLMLISQHKKKKVFIQHIVSKKLNAKEKSKMIELIKSFINKKCLIYTINGTFNGVITDVTNGGISINNGKNFEIVNIDYIIRIREYPKNKNGKKKSFVLD